MSANSGIAWTDHTFNPWWGCAKISAGCANCYAEGVAERFHSDNLWGAGAQRRHASEKAWNDPLRWNRAAERAGRRDLVFCSSMADVFEDRRDLDGARDRLFDMIRFLTPNLRWMLLTKRPENLHLIPPEVAQLVALGVSVEDQAAADRRTPLLLKAPAACRFISAEPLLGPVVLDGERCFVPQRCCSGAECGCMGLPIAPPPYLDWVIVGGESGPKARPMHLDWARSIRDQCAAAGVPFFFKQWGEWRPPLDSEEFNTARGMAQRVPSYIVAPNGTVHCFENIQTTMGGKAMLRVGKHAAGDHLDGRQWHQFPPFLREATA